MDAIACIYTSYVQSMHTEIYIVMFSYKKEIKP